MNELHGDVCDNIPTKTYLKNYVYFYAPTRAYPKDSTYTWCWITTKAHA
jgi:hypothetical protein